MAKTEELDKAIGDHEVWKIQLKSAIESGSIATPIQTIRMDNQCVFGKWLYGSTISAKDKASNHYKLVKVLHSEFHRVAARVAELALYGDKTEAEKIIAIGGDYARISSKLSQAMMEWKLDSK
jgi:hypothetical protein